MSLRGVNLGGWLIAEKWMTPSLFEGSTARNEYELSQEPKGRKQLTSHHQEFIREEDFKWLADHGIEIVRIPFGYWIFGDSKPYIGAIDQLDWAIEVAKKYNILVLLDMHGAVGGQNEKAHCGCGNSPKHTSWLSNRASKRDTIEVLEKIAKRYQKEQHIWGIQLLNEPTVGLLGLRLAWWYRTAYRRIAKVARPGTKIVFSDGFRPWSLVGAIRGRSDYPVVMDCHLYYCFGANKSSSYRIQKQRVVAAGHKLKLLNIFQPIIVGEWSGALDNSVRDSDRTDFISTQQKAYRSAIASFYWSYKLESNDSWNYRYLTEQGQLPRWSK